MKIVKRIAWIILFLIIGLVAAAIIVPTVFKDEIVEKVKITLNNQLNAEVDFDDVYLSIFSSFPNARINLENLSLTGIDQYKDTKLYTAEHIMVDISIPSLIKESIPYQIRKAKIEGARLNVIVAKNGTSNYMIFKESTENESNTTYTLDLDRYELDNWDISYVDHSSNIALNIHELNHTGKGRFTESVYDLDTYTSIGSLTANSDGVDYLYKTKANLDAIINVDLTNNKFTLKDNKLSLNELNIEGDGYVQLNGDDMYVDTKLKGLENKFRSYLSIVPNAYVDQLSDVDTKGTGSFTANIKGNYNADKAILPAIDIDLSIVDAYVNYNNMPQSIEDINAAIQIDAKEGNYNDLIVNIPTLKARVGNDPIEAKLLVTQSSVDPKLVGMLNADVNLENWKSAIPSEIITDMAGQLNANIAFEGKVSDIESSNYSNLKMSGQATMQNISVQQKDDLNIAVANGSIKADPSLLNIDIKGITYGDSDFEVKAVVKDPLMLAINTEKAIQSDITVRSKTINANQLMSTSTESTESAAPSTFDISNSKINISASADKILYEDQTWSNVKLEGKMNGDQIEINTANAKMNDNDIALKGALKNPMGYVNGSETLTGDLDIKSNKLDLNDFMTATEDTEETGNIIIPKNIDLNITGQIDDLTYTNMNLRNSTASIEVKDQIANLKALNTKTLGGQIDLKGAYRSQDDAKPSFDMMLDLSKIEFVQAFNKLETMQALAPIIKYVEGFFNSTLTFSGDLNDNMIPDLGSIDASGYIETYNSTLKDFPIINKLGDKLGLSTLKSFTLENTKNWFEVVDGTVELKPKSFTVDDIDMNISGKHGYGKDMNFLLKMKVPRAMLKKSALTSVVNEGLNALQEQANKLGVTIGDSDFIDLDVGITGTVESPKFSVKPVGYELSGTKEIIKGEIDKHIDKAKDSIKTVINDTKETIKDTITTVTNKAVDSVKTVVNEQVNTVKDSVKTVVNDKIDDIAKQAGLDSLSNTVKDVLGNGTDKEVDKIKDKIKDWNPFGKKKNN